MEEVKRNTTTFLEILQIGRTDAVAQWDESNFKRARQWALYAEEVYKKLKNKPSLAQILFKHINQNQKLSKDSMTQDVLFNNLKCATEKLQVILLQNLHLSSAQFSFVLDMYGVDFIALSNSNLNGLISDTFLIGCTKGIFFALSSMKDKLLNRLEESQESSRFGTIKPIDQLLADGLLEKSKLQTTSAEVCLDVCGKLLWKKLQNMLKIQKADPESGKGLISKELKQISCHENGMEVVLRMLIVPMEPEECSINLDSNDLVLDPLKQLVICWILGLSLDDSKVNYSEKLWSCPSSLLCNVSSLHIPFCKNYLNFLKSLGESLLERPSTFIRQDTTSYGSVFRDVIQRFQELLKGPKCISKLCKQMIRSWYLNDSASPSSTNSHMEIDEVKVNFWKNIYEQICQ